MADTEEVASPRTIQIKWSGTLYPMNWSESDTVLQLKEQIAAATQVQTHRQKLLNLKCKGKLAPDDAKLRDCDIKPNMTIMMMGSREDDISSIAPPAGFDENEVIEEKDWGMEVKCVKDNHINLSKIANRVTKYKFKVINPPRPGKKLLVLDVDYTLFDHRSTVERIQDLMRPYLHEFLTVAYEYFDIVIWSATGMSWVQAKMRELGVLSNPNYKIVMLLDHLAMITVDAPKYGVIGTKPLGVIWGKFPDQYTPKNSIIFDDLRRNFIMNPQNGLRIKAFRNGPVARATDDTLKRLAQYLVVIGQEDDMSRFDHDEWKATVKAAKKNGKLPDI